MSGRRKQVDHGLEMASNRNSMPEDHSTILLSETDLAGESTTDDASETTGLITAEPSGKHESQFGRYVNDVNFLVCWLSRARIVLTPVAYKGSACQHGSRRFFCWPCSFLQPYVVGQPNEDDFWVLGVMLVINTA
jgi:hypothetical protein